MPESASAILKELAALGSEQTKKVLLRHGVTEPFFGVKIGDMKPIVKRIKKNHDLSMSLYATGNSDAMYLAGLIADETKLTKKDLENWLKQATSSLLTEFMIPWLAAESKHGWDLGKKWIDAKDAKIQLAGWATLSSVVSITDDTELDLDAIRGLLSRVERDVHDAPNRVRYVMNGFLLAIGTFVRPLSNEAVATAKRIGPIHVDMNGTACNVPDVGEYVAKVEKMGRVGKKKKQARC
jgi:3-methyladenine DNA glycosylase AlkD